MPRENFDMTAEEVHAYLLEQRTAILATNGPHGFPHQSAMWYLPERGVVRMWTYRGSQKATNIRRDPRVSLLVESGEDYVSLRGVLLFGEIRLIDDFDRILQVGIALRRRYADPARPATVEALAQRATKRVVLELRPRRMVSWNHRRQREPL